MNKRNLAFTLAEILITLGIIGIVAAMTIPNLIINYQKIVIEKKLLKFYNLINQALKMSEIENGDKMTWLFMEKSLDDFYNTYWAKYLKSVGTKDFIVGGNNKRAKLIYLLDGSGFSIDEYQGHVDCHMYFCPVANDCVNFHEKDLGRKVFAFVFWPISNTAQFKYHYNKGVEPYVANWNGQFGNLYTNGIVGCNTNRGFMCTKLIQLNNWKFPKNYPWK